MPRSVLLRLSDMRDTINGISIVVHDVPYEAFSRNWGMQRAVERGLEIISEATRHIPEDYKTGEPDIPWRQITAIGNLLRHEYQRADALAVWNIVKDHLPALAEAVDRLLATARARESP